MNWSILPPEYLDYAYREPCLVHRPIPAGAEIPEELLVFERDVFGPEHDALVLGCYACLVAEGAGVDVEPCQAVQKDRASADTCPCPGCGERRRILSAAAGPVWRRAWLLIRIGRWRFGKWWYFTPIARLLRRLRYAIGA